MSSFAPSFKLEMTYKQETAKNIILMLGQNRVAYQKSASWDPLRVKDNVLRR